VARTGNGDRENGRDWRPQDALIGRSGNLVRDELGWRWCNVWAVLKPVQLSPSPIAGAGEGGV
jgi:hypothetical protein